MNENFLTKSDLKNFELKLNARCKQLEFRLTTRLGGLMIFYFLVAVALATIH